MTSTESATRKLLKAKDFGLLFGDVDGNSNDEDAEDGGAGAAASAGGERNEGEGEGERNDGGSKEQQREQREQRGYLSMMIKKPIDPNSPDEEGEDAGGEGGLSGTGSAASVSESMGPLASCCCMVGYCCLVIGSLMAAIEAFQDDNLSSVAIAGRVLLILFGLFACCAFSLCCAGCCAVLGNKQAATSSSGAAASLLGPPDLEVPKKAKFVFRRVNQQFKPDLAQYEAMLSRSSKPLSKEVKKLLKQKAAEEKKAASERQKQSEKELLSKVESEIKGSSPVSVKTLKQLLRPKVFFVRFDGDMSASGVPKLRQQITLILKVASKYDEVMLIANSPGGLVTEYGLAASQLIRIKNAGLKLIVCVDSVAASGGYMIASVANEIVAAPFAMIGSIGVVAYVPNFQRFLEDKDVDVYEFTAGKWKRTVDVVGKVTEEGKEKLQSELDDIHHVFKEHIRLNRPAVEDVEKIATGEAWLAVQARERGLVDTIMTSDEWIQQKMKSYEVIEVVENKEKKTLAELLSSSGLDGPDSKVCGADSFSFASDPASYIATVTSSVTDSLINWPRNAMQALSSMFGRIIPRFLLNNIGRSSGTARYQNLNSASYNNKIHVV